MVYVGDSFVTVVGATWTPETAKLFGRGDKKGYSKADHGSDRYQLPSGSGRRGMLTFKGIGAKIISTELTSDLLMKHWDEMVRYVQKRSAELSNSSASSYLTKAFASDFELQRGGVKAI